MNLNLFKPLVYLHNLPIDEFSNSFLCSIFIRYISKTTKKNINELYNELGYKRVPSTKKFESLKDLLEFNREEGIKYLPSYNLAFKKINELNLLDNNSLKEIINDKNSDLLSFIISLDLLEKRYIKERVNIYPRTYLYVFKDKFDLKMNLIIY